MPRPASILFACTLNLVRSPMAAALLARVRPDLAVASTGVRLPQAEAVDPFAAAVLREVGLDLSAHRPSAWDPLRHPGYDLLITLSAEAEAAADLWLRGLAMERRFWPMPEPLSLDMRREAILIEYRGLRDSLTQRIRESF